MGIADALPVSAPQACVPGAGLPGAGPGAPHPWHQLVLPTPQAGTPTTHVHVTPLQGKNYSCSLPIDGFYSLLGSDSLLIQCRSGLTAGQAAGSASASRDEAGCNISFAVKDPKVTVDCQAAECQMTVGTPRVDCQIAACSCPGGCNNCESHRRRASAASGLLCPPCTLPNTPLASTCPLLQPLSRPPAWSCCSPGRRLDVICPRPNGVGLPGRRVPT